MKTHGKYSACNIVSYEISHVGRRHDGQIKDVTYVCLVYACASTFNIQS